MTTTKKVCVDNFRKYAQVLEDFVVHGIKKKVLGHSKRMIKPTKNINDVKRMVNACRAKRVAVRVNLGRNKRVDYCGVLSGIYPALFTVRPDDEDFLGKTAYSYSDVLCGNVVIKRIENG